MKKIAFFGGSGGLGSQVIKFLNSYDYYSQYNFKLFIYILMRFLKSSINRLISNVV